ncbi:MAG: carbohydrate ABC transporter permease [Eubacteriales bacterium]|nr:carbohydrate ABC transporter permease [Eubacteriales bacterium]
MQNLSLSRSSRVRTPLDDRVYYGVVYVVLGLLLLITLYPLLYIVAASFSSAQAVTSGKVFLWPVDAGVEGYKAVFRHPNILNSYRNSFVYTVVGTCVNLTMTMLAAYPLSRRDMPHRGLLMFLFTFTMMFNGGMIPDYILLKDLRMIDTMWALIVPGSINVFNLILVRTFLMSSIPEALLEASQIDGCSDARYFVHILLPLAKPVMAVVTLYYAVAHWNNYFQAFLYLYNEDLYPLQLVLREILIANSMDTNMVVDPAMAEAQQNLADLLKYSLIVVSSAPVLILYPFVKKFFVKGVMIGSIKG